jgi:hypothetical protein
VENPEGSWAKNGVHVVNAQMNARTSRSKDGRSAYEIYYGKHEITNATYLLDPTILSCAQTEYGYTAAQEAMSILAKKNTDIRITLQELRRLMAEADSIFEEEAALSEKDQEGTESNYDAEHDLKNIIDTLYNVLGRNIKQTSPVPIQCRATKR